MTGFVQSVITIVLFILILGVLVVIHELGHFVTARLAGVRVLEFGIGFPPRAKVLRSKGETMYTLNWLPLGGFVKLEGEDGDAADDPARVLVEAAAGAPLDPRRRRADERAAGLRRSSPGSRCYGDPTIGFQVGTVQPGSPAEAAGVQSGRRGRRRSTASTSAPSMAVGPDRRRSRRTPARPSRSASSGPASATSPSP